MYNEQKLKTILSFTNALADRLNDEKKINFGELETDEASLEEATESAKRYAIKRKRQAGFSDEKLPDDETDEDGSIRERIRDYYRRTRKVVRG
jgi:hypothetical protein